MLVNYESGAMLVGNVNDFSAFLQYSRSVEKMYLNIVIMVHNEHRVHDIGWGRKRGGRRNPKPI